MRRPDCSVISPCWAHGIKKVARNVLTAPQTKASGCRPDSRSGNTDPPSPYQPYVESEGPRMGNSARSSPALSCLCPLHPKSWHAAAQEQASWFLCTCRKCMAGEDLGSARLNPTNCLLAQPLNALHVRHTLRELRGCNPPQAARGTRALI